MNTFRSLLLAGAMVTATVLPASADLPVVDFTQLKEWAQQLQYAVQQVQYLQQQVQQAIQTVHALTNIPQNLIDQVEGLLQSSVQNPLQGINLNLTSLMMGSGSGVCPGANGMLSATQGWTATGGDFTGSLMNGSATQLASLLSCTQQMLQSAQQRVTQLPQLLQELQDCSDVACTTAVSGRIQLETATINTQQQEALLIGLAQQQQRWAADDMVLQKQRADATALLNSLPTGTPGGNISNDSIPPGGLTASASVFQP